MLLPLVLILLILIVTVFVLYINQSVTVNRYLKTIEDINNDKVFSSINISLTSNNNIFYYKLISNELIYTYNLYKINSNGEISTINLNTLVETISINFNDYEDATQIYGNIIIKTNMD